MSQPAYLIANVKVTDPEQYEKYRAYSSKAIAEFGAEVIVRGGEMEVLEGEAHPRTIVLKFQSMAQAKAFYDSPTYRQGRELRKDASEGCIIIVEGF